MELAEVYRVIYDGPDDKLRGVILSVDLDNGCQYLFKDEGLDRFNNPRDIYFEYLFLTDYMKADDEIDKSSKPDIKSGAHIMLNGPTEASIDATGGYSIQFFFCGAFHGSIHVHSEIIPAPQKIVFLSEDCKKFLKVYYAVFQNAVEAKVKVKLLDVKSEFELYGSISARTSAIKHPAYSSIIFFKERGEKVKLEPGIETSLLLSRPLVAVPLGFELILEFGLFSENKKVLQEKVFIDADKYFRNSKSVHYVPCCNHFKIQVEIDWRSERNPKEFEPYDPSSEEEDA